MRSSASDHLSLPLCPLKRNRSSSLIPPPSPFKLQNSSLPPAVSSRVLLLSALFNYVCPECDRSLSSPRHVTSSTTPRRSYHCMPLDAPISRSLPIHHFLSPAVLYPHCIHLSAAAHPLNHNSRLWVSPRQVQARMSNVHHDTLVTTRTGRHGSTPVTCYFPWSSKVSANASRQLPSREHESQISTRDVSGNFRSGATSSFSLINVGLS